MIEIFELEKKWIDDLVVQLTNPLPQAKLDNLFFLNLVLVLLFRFFHLYLQLFQLRRCPIVVLNYLLGVSAIFEERYVPFNGGLLLLQLGHYVLIDCQLLPEMVSLRFFYC